ncbi:hypothetical protein BBAL3_2613 [Brevundimonas sp. BAL3]|uniref:hypothetical protein n=1 Tax=Brevundimonas sp. BAL3 TaxID=391600 RepID=UPI00017EBAE0|nr:hypothetical protein [Brevundimonas sp. BAL3]EDX81456.1 hypothetical protein BBAL3_2613 [Brevundimonas sp. BAL3]
MKNKTSKRQAKLLKATHAAKRGLLSDPAQRAVASAASIRAVVEAEALRSRLTDTVRLEALRTGEKVQRLPASGPVRLKSRDGLVSLHTSGSLDDDEVRAGLAYRMCWEAASAGLKSSMANGERVSGGARGDALDIKRAYLMARLNQMERAVGAIMQDGRELLALRLIAGEGRTLTSLASGGNAKVAQLAALRRALAAVASVLPQGGLRIRDG